MGAPKYSFAWINCVWVEMGDRFEFRVEGEKLGGKIPGLLQSKGKRSNYKKSRIVYPHIHSHVNSYKTQFEHHYK